MDDDDDGVLDAQDDFPKDDSEQRDTDRDGIGDNADQDDDGDGLCSRVRRHGAISWAFGEDFGV